MTQKITNKSDWMNDALALKGAIVSDHSTYARSIGLNDGTTASIRFVGNSRIGFFLLLVLLSEDKNNAAMAELEKASTHTKYLIEHGIPIRAALLCVGERYFLHNTTHVQELTTSELVNWFSGLHPDLSQRQAGKVKPINKSLNDKFQDFTRRHLSPFIICNDVDALLLPNEKRMRPVVVELKRPEESISTWRPYSADISNFRASLQIAKICNGDAATIAYNETSNPDFLLLKYSIAPLRGTDTETCALQNSELWSWRITKEKMNAEHPISEPQHYSGKVAGWLVHWVLFDVTESGPKTRILVDTSRKQVVELSKY